MKGEYSGGPVPKRPPPKPDPVDRIVNELHDIADALWFIAVLIRPAPEVEVPDSIGATLQAATERLKASKTTLQGAVDSAPPTT
jgi:hypothetical protein